METTKTLIGRVDGFHGDSIRVSVQMPAGHYETHWFSALKSPACRVGDGVRLNKFSNGDWAITEVGDIYVGGC